MSIEEIRDKIHTLQYGDCNPTDMLQEICGVFLRHFCIEACGWVIWPQEVEAYCYCQRNPDLFVHRNILQKNRFGYLYVHRHPDNPENNKGKNTPKGRAGIDVCLSDNDDMYFGMLIRSAIATNNKITFQAQGPYALYRELKKGHGPDFFKEIESSFALKEWSERKGYVFFSPRIGLPEGRDNIYVSKDLRAVIAESLVGTHFRMKEELFKGMNIPVDDKKAIAGSILGYTPAEYKK